MVFYNVLCFRSQGIFFCNLLCCASETKVWSFAMFWNVLCFSSQGIMFCKAFVLCFRSQGDVLYCTALWCVSEAKVWSIVLYCYVLRFRSQCVMFCIVLYCVLFQKPRYDPLYCIAFCGVFQKPRCDLFYCISLCFVSEAKMRSFVLHCTVFCFRSQGVIVAFHCTVFCFCSQGVILCIALHCVLFQKSRYDLRDSHHDSRGHAGSLPLHPTEIRL